MKRVIVKRVGLGAVAAAAILFGSPPQSTAAEPDSPGKMAYARYCSSCHGVGGKGDGPLAGMLATKPTDLTQIAKNAGGDYPMMKVAQSIDGTTPIRGHGDIDMPVWGERFRAEATAPLTRHAEARGKVLLIAEYIRSIQVK